MIEFDMRLEIHEMRYKMVRALTSELLELDKRIKSTFDKLDFDKVIEEEIAVSIRKHIRDAIDDAARKHTAKYATKIDKLVKKAVMENSL